MTFLIEHVDDENIVFYVNGLSVGHWNHDVEGWAGIEAAEDLFRRTARILGAELIEE